MRQPWHSLAHHALIYHRVTLLLASETRSWFRERSTAAKQEHNQQDNDHQRYQPATDVHNKSPLLRLAKARCRSLRLSRNNDNKKADVAEHLEVFDHVGLLTNEPPGTAELLFI
jgi:hypothetical protein